MRFAGGGQRPLGRFEPGRVECLLIVVCVARETKKEVSGRAGDVSVDRGGNLSRQGAMLVVGAAVAADPQVGQSNEACCCPALHLPCFAFLGVNNHWELPDGKF